MAESPSRSLPNYDRAPVIEPPHARSIDERRERRAAAIALLDEWLADDSGYDEATWPSLKKDIDASRPAARKRFSD